MTLETAIRNANRGMSLSVQGESDIAKEEGFSYYPYDDIAHNCTVGNGVLLHYGPCTHQQKQTRYELKALNAQFKTRLAEAQQYVRVFVQETQLDQAQFDALTSFVFNVGVGNARSVLKLMNDGDFAAAAEKMSAYVWVTEKSKQGKSIKVQSNGLKNRRKREIEPFMPQSK